MEGIPTYSVRMRLWIPNSDSLCITLAILQVEYKE
jgi:hypothetical protein